MHMVYHYRIPQYLWDLINYTLQRHLLLVLKCTRMKLKHMFRSFDYQMFYTVNRNVLFIMCINEWTWVYLTFINDGMAYLCWVHCIFFVLDTCKFGVDCDYPCHCQEGETCGSVDGSCPAGCDDGNIMEPDDYWHTGAWTGYGCQFGRYLNNKIHYVILCTLNEYRTLSISG